MSLERICVGHLLSFVYRIQFKAALVMFTIHTRRCPDYLTDSVQVCNSDPARTPLRSASSSDYTVPRTRTGLGDRAFSVAGPVVWNSLPTAVREADSLHSFRRKIKTHLFTLCFNDWLFGFIYFANFYIIMHSQNPSQSPATARWSAYISINQSINQFLIHVHRAEKTRIE